MPIPCRLTVGFINSLPVVRRLLAKPTVWNLTVLLASLFSPSILAQTTSGYQWKNAQILGGGFVSGVVYSQTEKDLIYARTDVGGAYRWNSATATWIPLTDFLGANDENCSGILSIATDPGNPNRVYLATGLYTQSWAGTGAIFASADKGTTWTRTSLPLKLGGNEDGRSAGERLQVDPNLGSTLLLGSSTDGLWRSTDYGATWSKVSSFPVATSPIGSGGISFVLFDKNSSTTGNATQTIYVGVLRAGPSLYRSTDGGATWVPVPGQPVLMPHQAALAASGTLYVAFSNGPGPNNITAGTVGKYSPASNQWTDISPPAGQGGYGSVSLDLQKPGILLVGTIDRWYPKDEIFRSTDDGATWKPLLANATFDHTLAPYAAKLTPHWLGDVNIDPFNSANAWFVTGYGVYGTTNLTVADAGTPVKWSFMDKGLEETVATGLICPPAGAPVISIVGDIDGFKHDSLTVAAPRFPPGYGTTTGIDVAETKPDFLVRSYNNATGKYGGYSTDGGSTWTPFASFPTGTTGGGTLAVAANGSTIVWAPIGAGVAYSTDRGSTWKASAGIKAGIVPVADRVNSATFYAYDGLTGQVLVSTDGGVSFAVKATSLPTVPDYQLNIATLVATFGNEGDLWLTNPAGLYHSANSGTTFSKVSSVKNAARVAPGLAATGKTYPAVYIVGTVNEVYGIFRSDDLGTSWTRLNDDQHQFLGIRALAADRRTYGRIYLGTSGRGIVYGSGTFGTTNLVTGVDEPVVEPVTMYPNPATHQFIIKASGSFSYQIFNVSGQHQEIGTGENECRVGSNLPVGLYVIKVQPKSGITTSVKVMKW